MKINIKVFYKLVVSFLLVTARYVQRIQNGKFVISFQYLKKEKLGWWDILPAYKQKTLQNETINLGRHGQACPNSPK